MPDRHYGEELSINNELIDSKSYEFYKAKTSSDVYSFGLTLLSTLLERKQMVYCKFKKKR
jgi:hypothetical protein